MLQAPLLPFNLTLKKAHRARQFTGSEVEVTRPSVTKKCQIVTLATNFHRFYLVLHTSVGVA